MATVTLQFVAENNLGSSLIRWFSAADVSHVDCVLPDGRLLGASSDRPSGVRIRPQDYRDFSRVVHLSIPCTDAQARLYHAFLREQLGKPYDRRAILAFALNRDWRRDDSWQCSELQAAAGEESGILPRLYLPVQKITPATCAIAYSAVGATISFQR